MPDYYDPLEQKKFKIALKQAITEQWRGILRGNSERAIEDDAEEDVVMSDNYNYPLTTTIITHC